MTRKQAISLAIQALSEAGENEEAIAKLELPIYNNVDVPRETAALKVNIYTHYDFRD